MGKIVVAIAALAMASVLAGCNSSASTGSSASHLTQAELEFLAGYGSSMQSTPLRDQATQLLIKKCMAGRGLKYITGVPSGSSGQSSDTSRQPYLPGLGTARNEALAVKRRQDSGYHLFSNYRTGNASSVPPNDLYVRSLGPAERDAYSRALFGRQARSKTIRLPNGATLTYPTEGCVAESQTQLYGSSGAAQRTLALPQALLEQVVAATNSDPAVTAKNSDWSKCVSAATGRSFATPDKIVAGLQREYDAHGASQAVRRREIAYSVADTRCTFRTGLAPAYASAFRRQADKVVGPTRRLLQQTLEIVRTATVRAERVVTSATGAQ
jgi:hypothetical protein